MTTPASSDVLGSRALNALFTALDSTQTTLSNPGVGATVPNPPRGVIVAVWVVGILALAILWAASRR
ncbi:MAG: hypothetical protein HKO10_06650 [Acidimicrobiia bacterium]|nr:hypothetical protein [Acidimicrobiia bacterium]